MSTLEKEIDENRRKIHTDAYPMSIGELINLYRDGEIDIHPEFQRIYRWTDSQKSKLIESILLGIPLPSIFVAQREDGIWDVVDGVQRLSTIFSFLGIYKDENGESLPGLKLTATEYIKSLDGMYWEHTEVEHALSADIKRAFKREKIDVKIIKKESDGKAKYDLFQRLNTGGTTLSDQEVRNCLLIMIDHEKYDWLKELSENPDFKNCLPLSEKMEEEQGYMEIALRFIVYRYFNKLDGFEKYVDLNELLTDAMKKIFEKPYFDLDEEKKLFEQVFKLLNDTLEDNSFRQYDIEKEKYKGPFSLSFFEVIAIGLSYNFDNSEVVTDKIREISRNLKNDPIFIDNTKYGTRSINRFKVLIEYGKQQFKI
jgi:uncharacterized protein with ParB-like and HNH nuclease domain